MNINIKRLLGLLVLTMILIIPFNVSAKDYKVIISFFAEGGKVSSGNIDVYNNVVFEKDGTKADVTYKSTDTINHINSLDKKTTFTLKKKNKAQIKNKEWYGKKYTDGSAVFFSNSKKYKVSDIVKQLKIDTEYYSRKGGDIEIFLYAAYPKVDGKSTSTTSSSTSKKTTSSKSSVAVKSVSLNKGNITINVGDTYQLKATIKPKNATNKKVTWKSSNKKIVTVTKKGKIKGKSAGKATITVTTKSGKKTAKKTITVKESKNTSVTTMNVNVLTYESMNLYVDTYYDLKVFVGKNINNVSWSSEDVNIADVTSNGIVHAKKAGKVNIVANSSSGQDKIQLNIRKYEEPTDYSLNNAKCSKINATIKVNNKESNSNNVYNCLSDLELIHPESNSNTTYQGQIIQTQGFTITNNNIYFSSPMNGTCFIKTSAKTIPDDDDKRLIPTVYIGKISRNANSYNNMKFMKIEYAGHGQGIDTNDGKLYINIAGRLYTDSEANSESSYIDTIYKGIGIFNFPSSSGVITGRPTKVITINSKFAWTEHEISNTYNGYIDNIKEIASDPKSGGNYYNSPEVSVFDGETEDIIAVKFPKYAAFYKKNKKGKISFIKKLDLDTNYENQQGSEVNSKYFYTVGGTTQDIKNNLTEKFTIVRYDINTGKHNSYKIDLADYIRANGYFFVEPEGISINNQTLYAGLVTGVCVDYDNNYCKKYRQFNSIVKVTGL